MRGLGFGVFDLLPERRFPSMLAGHSQRRDETLRGEKVTVSTCGVDPLDIIALFSD